MTRATLYRALTRERSETGKGTRTIPPAASATTPRLPLTDPSLRAPAHSRALSLRSRVRRRGLSRVRVLPGAHATRNAIPCRRRSIPGRRGYTWLTPARGCKRYDSRPDRRILQNATKSGPAQPSSSHGLHDKEHGEDP